MKTELATYLQCIIYPPIAAYTTYGISLTHKVVDVLKMSSSHNHIPSSEKGAEARAHCNREFPEGQLGHGSSKYVKYTITTIEVRNCVTAAM